MIMSLSRKIIFIADSSSSRPYAVLSERLFDDSSKNVSEFFLR